MFLMKWSFLILVTSFILFLSLPFSVQARHEGEPDEIEIKYIQKPGELIPLETVFTTEDGAEIRLGDLFDGRPVVLMFAYYECPTLCGVALEDLGTALKNVNLEIGKDFNIAVISIDPEETDRTAAAAKDKIFHHSALEATPESWRFLTGTESNIQTMTEAVGFQYVYDEEMDMYFHPTGVVVATPDGRIARYIDGIGYDPLSLRLALVEASKLQIGSITDAVGLFCYQYDDVTGQYTLAVMRLMQIAGVATAGILGAAIYFLKRRERKTGADRL